MAMKLLDGERDWLTQITSDLPNDLLKLVYADWLQENGDEDRAHFVRAYVETDSNRKAFPAPRVEWKEWADLIGWMMVQSTIFAPRPASVRATLLKLARPALRMVRKDTTDTAIPVGASKFGGYPDLPPKFAWPTGDTCRAIFRDPTAGEARLAGFVAQINLALIAKTQAARDLPKKGLLSFFRFQDWENGNPNRVGVRCIYLPSTKGLRRTKPPQPLTAGNVRMASSRLTFVETLDWPCLSGGPWSADYKFDQRFRKSVGYRYLDDYRKPNSHNMLGFARAFGRKDPTPDREHRHLIYLKNPGTKDLRVQEGLQIQIHRDDLKAANFNAIKLVWVDFD